VTRVVDYTKIKVEREGALQTITLDDPKHMNAMGETMRVEFIDAMMHAIENADVRAILLTGAGRGFCAGANLSEFAATFAKGEIPDVGAMLRQDLNALLVRMTTCEKPIIAAVNGPAAGFGCGLALAADIVLVARSACFVQSFVRLGANPDGGSSWFLPRLLGRGRAAAMMLLGEKMSAKDAVAQGLAYAEFEDHALAGAARELAQRLALGPTRAYAAIKTLIAESEGSDLADQLEREASHQVALFETRDCREGVAAFMEGRRPTFRGD
jgi:2-(1,2-epoxy-1,2-dihydrophenyl)acetyl-CoA isomerase